MDNNNSPQMVKTLSKFDLLAIGVGAVIGWSWVIYAGFWSATPGTLGGILAFAVAGILCSLIGLVYAELTSAFPKIGVDVSVTYLGLGKIPSVIVMWCTLFLWISFVFIEAIMFPIILKNLGFAIPEAGYLFTFVGTPVYASYAAVSLALNTFFALINFRGIQVAGWVQTAAVAIIAAAAVFFCGSGIFLGDASNAQPLFTDGKGLSAVMLMVPGFLSGFNAIPTAVEETNVKPKTVGKLVLATVWGSVIFYVLIIVGLSLSMPAELRGGDGLVVVEAVKVLFNGNKIATLFVTFASLMGMLTTWNASYIAGSRFLFGMSRAKMMPAAFGNLHPKYGTPKNALLFMFILGTIAPFVGANQEIYVAMVDVSSFGLVITWLIVALTFVKLRKNMPDIARPYKVPAGNFIGWLTVIYCICYLFLYTPWGPSGLTNLEWVIVAIVIVAGIIVYFTYNRRGGNIPDEERKKLFLGE